MLKQISITPQALTEPQKTVSVLPTPNLLPQTMQQTRATTAARRLFALLPPLDVTEPEVFMAATIATFVEYPVEVMDLAVPKIAQRSDRPTLKLIKAVCEELYAPLERQIEREMAERSYRKGLPPPRRQRTPEEQARVDAQVEEVKRLLGTPTPKLHIAPEPRHDGNHAARVAADLAARAARRAARPPDEGTYLYLDEASP